MAKRKSQRYQQRMVKAYAKIVHPRAFTEGQLVLRAVEHVRKKKSQDPPNLPRNGNGPTSSGKPMIADITSSQRKMEQS